MLMLAAEKRHNSLLEWLIDEKKVDLNIQDNYDRNALKYAITSENEQASRKLIEAGIDLDNVDFWYQTNVIKAAEMNQSTIL